MKKFRKFLSTKNNTKRSEYLEENSKNTHDENINEQSESHDTGIGNLKIETEKGQSKFEDLENTIDRANALKQKLEEIQKQGESRLSELSVLKNVAQEDIKDVHKRVNTFLDNLQRKTIEELDLLEAVQKKTISDKLSSISQMIEELVSEVNILDADKVKRNTEMNFDPEQKVSELIESFDFAGSVIANDIKTTTLKICKCKDPESVFKSLTRLVTLCTAREHVCENHGALKLNPTYNAEVVLENSQDDVRNTLLSSDSRKEEIRKLRDQLQLALMLQSREEQMQLEQLQQERVKQKQSNQKLLQQKTIEKEKERLNQLKKRQLESNEERMRKEKLHQEQLRKEKEHQEQVRQRTEGERRSKQEQIHEMLDEYLKHELRRQDIIRQKHIRTEQSRQEQMKEQERLAKLRQSQQTELREKQTRLKETRQEQTQKEIDKQHEVQQKQQLARQEYLKQSQLEQLRFEKVRQEQLEQERIRQEKIRQERIEQQKKEEEMRLSRESLIRQEKEKKEKLRQEQLLQQKEQEEKIQEQQRQLREQQINALKEDQARQAELLKQLYKQIN